MLYRPQWTRPTYDLAGLIAWLGTRNPTEEYNYVDNTSCMGAQFCAAAGREYDTRAAPLKEMYDNRGSGPISLRPGRTFEVVMEQVAVGTPRTFGAALERAREML